MIKLSKNNKIGEKVILSLLLLSILVPFNAYADNMVAVEEPIEKPYAIVVSGEENINAYKKAGIIRSYTPKGTSNEKGVSMLSDISPRGASIPTTNWNLANNNSRKFNYSMSSYLYSDYKYTPDPIYLDIWHELVPNQAQKFKLQCYKASNNSLFDTFDLDIDDIIAVGLATPLGQYYFKYTSTNGSRISGSGLVY